MIDDWLRIPYINNQVDMGESRTMAWHAVGHGADALLYWQWRSAYNGQDQYHGSLVDQSGQPRPFYEDAAQIGREFAKVSELLVGSEIKPKVAVLNDYDSRWSMNWQKPAQGFRLRRAFAELLQTFRRAEYPGGYHLCR